MAQNFDTPLFSSDQSIDRVLNAGLPVVLVFLAGTASTSFDQAIKTLAKQEAGKLLIVQLNVKDSPDTTRRYEIHNPPAVVTVKNGQVQSKAENILADDLQRHVSYLLGKGPKPEPKAQPHYAEARAQASGPSYATPPQSSYSSGASGQSLGHPVAVSDATFERDVLRSPIPVVVDFWAPWCGPCRMVAPTLDKLASEWKGKALIAKVNVDENPMIAGQYGVSGIPTMMVFSGGKQLDRWAGALPEPALRARLANSIK